MNFNVMTSPETLLFHRCECSKQQPHLKQPKELADLRTSLMATSEKTIQLPPVIVPLEEA